MTRNTFTIIIASIFWSVSSLNPTFAADSACQEGQDVLGLAVTTLPKQKTEETPGLVVNDVIPSSQGARLGLQKGDVIEQVNSWRARDCQSFSRAVQDAHSEQKAILLLVRRSNLFIHRTYAWG